MDKIELVEMSKKEELTFPFLINKIVDRFGEKNAMAIVGEKAITYNELKKKIESLIHFLEKLGVNPGDKVAILSNNKPGWGIAYFAATFMGAVAVPLLPDFSISEIENIIEHSESKILFVSEGLIPKTDHLDTKSLNHTIQIENYRILKGNSDCEYNFSEKPAKKYDVKEDDLAAIIYTSGTTGSSKGVMLTHKNISFNALKGRVIQHIDSEDRFLSILPLSHTYENTLGLVLPLISGSCVYYIGKTPTPAVLLPALKKVKPTMMLTVPLIIEKIYRSKILPTFTSKGFIKALYKIPTIRKTLHKIAGKKLLETFGGELKFFGIGGAKLDPIVEKFLVEARFPYAIGYGLTETAPLLAGANPQKTVLGSTGPAIEDIELIINDPDPATGEGEIWARGPMVMKGYYKEPEKTAEVITEDGWFKTGDLGVLDKDNNLFIKGRLKNMIIGANGENIYPEEIESVINNFKHVVESLVMQQKGKLVALVHFNIQELEEKYHHMKDEINGQIDNIVAELIIELHQYVNSKVNRFSKLQAIEFQPEPFIKTATKKIKRFKYA